MREGKNMKKTINILCVGNSFAIDMATYVHQIAKSNGLDINIGVLYIGGCSIEHHWRNYLSKDKEYIFYLNGDQYSPDYCDFFYPFPLFKWDYITFQQRSGDSVDSTTFFPELTLLMEGVRKLSDATFLLHKTWSYAIEYSHERYGSNPLDQKAMTRDINQAYEEVSQKTNTPYIIPSGVAVDLARKVFGDYLNRDGYHLNDRGRVLTGFTMVYFITGNLDLDLSKFNPLDYRYDELTGPVPQEELTRLIEIAKEAVRNNKGHNLYD